MKVKIIIIVLLVVTMSAFGQTDVFTLVKTGLSKQVEEAIQAGARINDRSAESGMTAWDYADRNPALKGTQAWMDLDQARK